MCGRYTFVPGKLFYEDLEIENRDEEVEANYNAAPGEILPVVVKNSPKRIEKMKWGLVPFWAKDPRIGYKMINARAEEIQLKPSFRAPLKNKRCLVPAAGFYEWGLVGREKLPYYFRPKDGGIYTFAGLFDIWKDAEGREWKSFTIITTQANGVVGKIHNRMPVILTGAAREIWTDNKKYDPQEISGILTPLPDREMTSYRVSLAVNSPKNNNAELINPV